MNKNTPETSQQQPPDVHNPKFITLSKRTVDITNQQFGRWTVIGPISAHNRKRVLWLCRCECGNMSFITGPDLRRKHTRSCGCLLAEITAHSHTTHGLSKDPLYRMWGHIVARCTDPSDAAYKDYGGRGITICTEWRHNFRAFYDYVTRLEYYGKEGYSIDRINNSLGYQENNLRFATPTEQAINRRSTLTLTCNGETKLITEWAEIIGIKGATLRSRIRQGLTIDRILFPGKLSSSSARPTKRA